EGGAAAALDVVAEGGVAAGAVIQVAHEEVGGAAGDALVGAGAAAADEHVGEGEPVDAVEAGLRHVEVARLEADDVLRQGPDALDSVHAVAPRAEVVVQHLAVEVQEVAELV